MKRIDTEITMAEIRELVRMQAPTILEIGANDAVDTEKFLKAFPACTIHGFEPDPRAIARWHKRMEPYRDQFGSRLQLHEIALAHERTTLPFYQSGGQPPYECWKDYGEWDKSGSLKQFDKHCEKDPWMVCGKSVIQVPCRTLDDWAAEFLPTGTIDLVWMDVQSGEDLVLRGAAATIPRIRWIYTEIHEQHYYCDQASVGQVQSLLPGFDLVAAYPCENYLFENRGG